MCTCAGCSEFPDCTWGTEVLLGGTGDSGKKENTPNRVRLGSYVTLQSEGQKTTWKHSLEWRGTWKTGNRAESKRMTLVRWISREVQPHQGSTAGKHLWCSELLQRHSKVWSETEWASVARGETSALYSSTPTGYCHQFTLGGSRNVSHSQDMFTSILTTSHIKTVGKFHQNVRVPPIGRDQTANQQPQTDKGSDTGHHCCSWWRNNNGHGRWCKDVAL